MLAGITYPSQEPRCFCTCQAKRVTQTSSFKVQETTCCCQGAKSPGYACWVKTPRIECWSAQRITYSTTNIYSQNDSRQNISTMTVLTLTYSQCSRTNDCDRVHNCARMVTLDVTIVTKRPIHKCSGRRVGSKVTTKDLRFWGTSSLFHKPLEHLTDIVAG